MRVSEVVDRKTSERIEEEDGFLKRKGMHPCGKLYFPIDLDV
jgi:hypothetical protein